MSLAGRTVLVTGAASGVGRASALRLAADGATVICCDRREEPRPGGFDAEPSVPTTELISARGGGASWAPTDVTVEGALEAALDLAESDAPLWGAVLAAGVFVRDASILDESPDEHDRVLNVNERAVWLGCRAVGQRLAQEGHGGRIVCVASISGLVGLPLEPGYCASKGAVVNLVRAVALDLAPYQVTVNSVCPGFVATAMLRSDLAVPSRRAELETSAPLGRLGTPDDVAAAVSFLMSDGAGFITGAALPVDGGYTCR